MKFRQYQAAALEAGCRRDGTPERASYADAQAEPPDTVWRQPTREDWLGVLAHEFPYPCAGALTADQFRGVLRAANQI